MSTAVYEPILVQGPSQVSPTHDDGLRCDVLLFVAAPSEEDQLKKVAKQLGLSFLRRQGAFFEYFDLGRVGTYQRVMAVRTEIGPFSNDGSTARALLAKSETRATALVSVGMAFGVNRKSQKHGDVLVSKILLTYDDRRVYGGSWCSGVRTDYTSVRPHFAKPTMINALERLSQTDEWRNNVNFGAMLTGGARIHSSKYRNQLVKALSGHGEQIIGGEMEGAGLLAASHPESPAWVIVKGICDFADEKRDQEVGVWRKIACKRAATFVLTALRDFNPELEINDLNQS